MLYYPSRLFLNYLTVGSENTASFSPFFPHTQRNLPLPPPSHRKKIIFTK